MVESTLNYLADLAEKPYFYLYEPPPGTPWRNTKGDRRSVAIHDARELVPAPSLDEEGFLLTSHETSVQNLYDPNTVRDLYYREVEELVRKLTGATRVVASDHNVRAAGSTLGAADRERRYSSSASTPTLAVHVSPPTPHSTIRRVRPIRRHASRSRCGRSCSSQRCLRPQQQVARTDVGTLSFASGG